MNSAREQPVTASVAVFTSMILPSAPMVTSGSRLASIRLRLYALAALAGPGRGRAPLGPLGEMAGRDGGDEKGGERDPVLRIRDGERVDGRQEEEVEAQHAEHRRHHRRPLPQPVATNRTTSRYASATVVVLSVA